MMSQIDVDQRNTNALIATAIMYQKQRNDLLAVAENNLKIIRWVYDTTIETGLLGPLEYGILGQAIAETETAIAAVKGEK